MGLLIKKKKAFKIQHKQKALQLIYYMQRGSKLWDLFWRSPGKIPKCRIVSLTVSSLLIMSPSQHGVLSSGVHLGRKLFHIPSFAWKEGILFIASQIQRRETFIFKCGNHLFSIYSRRYCQMSQGLCKPPNSWKPIKHKPFHVKHGFWWTEATRLCSHVNVGCVHMSKLGSLANALYSSHKRFRKTTN